MKARGITAALVGVLIAAAAARSATAGDWHKVESPNFVLFGDVSSAELNGYADKLEAFDTLLCDLHGLDAGQASARKLPIYVVRNEDERQRIAPGIASGIGGYYTAHSDDIYAMATTELGRDTNILFHEYTHHFMLQHFSAAYPAWLVEGYAEYFMTARVSSDRIVIGEPLINRTFGMLNGGAWLPLRTVVEKRPYQLHGREISQYYAEAWALAHYFLSDALAARPVRYPQLKAYIKLINEGADPASALESVTGTPLEDLDKRLRDYIARPVLSVLLPRRAGRTASAVLTDMPPSAEMLLDRQAVLSPAAAKNPKLSIASIRDAARRYPSDTFAQDVLALAELRIGDRAKGREILARQLSAEPNSADLLRWTATDLMDQADEGIAADRKQQYARAFALLVKAYGLDVNYQTLAQIVRARKVLDARYPTDNSLETALFAQELAPQVAEMRMEAARALMLRDRLQEAEAELRPIVNNPHESEAVAAGRALLGEIEARAAASKRLASASAPP